MSQDEVTVTLPMKRKAHEPDVWETEPGALAEYDGWAVVKSSYTIDPGGNGRVTLVLRKPVGAAP
jgi:hypothetical protein